MISIKYLLLGDQNAGHGGRLREVARRRFLKGLEGIQCIRRIQRSFHPFHVYCTPNDRSEDDGSGLCMSPLEIIKNNPNMMFFVKFQ